MKPIDVLTIENVMNLPMTNFSDLEELEDVVPATGSWVMELADGRRAAFYFDDQDKVSPLDTIPEFDAGEFWSVDVQEEEVSEGFKRDEEGFLLIPKSIVAKVYFQSFPN